MDPVDLERLVDRELKQLPRPRAPRTLLPRVLAATVGHDGYAPAATGWFTWSRAAQAASVIAVVLLVVATSRFLAAPPTGVSDAARTAGDAATVMRVFWEVLLQPVATYILFLGVMLVLACAAAWAAFEVALGGASQQ
jgi:hypothetical protein